MGVLTEHMTHLCGEIRAMRRARQALMRELAHGTRRRRDMVLEMRNSFSMAHADMAKSGRANRHAFVSNLRREVARQRQDLRSDLAGVRRAWSSNRA